MTINHSCHEIPSQTLEESTKLNAADYEATSGYQLWSDEVENREENNEENSTRLYVQTGRVRGKTVDLITPATLKPSTQKSRVEDSKELNKKHGTPSAKETQRYHKQAKTAGESTGGASFKKKSNVIVIPR